MIPRLADSRGVSIIAVVALVLMLGVFGSVVLSLTTTETNTSINDFRSLQALEIARGGLEYGIKQYKANPDSYTGTSSTALGTGTFTVTVTDLGGGQKKLSASANAGSAVRVSAAVMTWGGEAIADSLVPTGTTNWPDGDCNPDDGDSDDSNWSGWNHWDNHHHHHYYHHHDHYSYSSSDYDGDEGTASIDTGNSATSDGSGSLKVETNDIEHSWIKDCWEQTLTTPIPPSTTVDLSLKYKFVSTPSCGSTYPQCKLSVIYVYANGSTQTAWSVTNTSSSNTGWVSVGPITQTTLSTANLTTIRLSYDLKNDDHSWGVTQTQAWFDEVSLLGTPAEVTWQETY
jgi:hypothetical protein